LKIGIVDVETTAIKPQIGLIVEVGIVKLDSETGEIEVIFDSIVKEESFGGQHRNAWIFSNSDLTFEDVINAELLSNVSHSIQDALNAYPMTSFNKDFDFGFLKHKGFTIPNELPCIMLTATDYCKIPHKNQNYRRIPELVQKFKWPSVEEAWRFYFPGVRYVEKHRAADDAVHEAKILHEMIKLGHFKIHDA